MFHNKLIVFALLLTGCSLICAAATSQLDVSLPNAGLSPEVPATDDLEKKTTTTTLAPTAPTTVSTTSSTTTHATTTTTTPEPTTAAPTTSTSTTTAAPPAPTTTAPNTTTAVPPAPTPTTPAPVPTPTTPAPAPAPYPEPSIGQWNSSCILVKLGAQLNITYETKDNYTNTTLYNIPVDSVVDNTDCINNVTQSMQINWGPADAQHSMVLQFNLMNKSSVLTMMRFVIPVVGDRFPNAMENQTINLLHRGSDFDAPMQMSYHCTRPQRFNLTATVIDSQVVGTVTVHDVQVEAFRKPSNATVFSTARDCDSAETPDIVPIAVGIALVAMIMIILISYLCARRRSTSRGYMSF